MSGTRTGEQVLAEHVSVMGDELGQLFNALSTELTWLHWRWGQYVKLYAGKPERLEVLNAAAPTFFWIVQQVLWFETLLGITRVAGPEHTGKKRNLSVRRLPALIGDLALRERAERLVQVVSTECEFAMDWRNRHIAHRDLDVVLGQHPMPLSPASHEAVDAALDAIGALLNAIEEHYLRSTTGYRFSVLTRDADELVYVLRDGLRRERTRQAKLERGEYDPQDWDDDLPAI